VGAAGAAGVLGLSDNNIGVSGDSNTGVGVKGHSGNEIGVSGSSEGNSLGAIGVLGLANNGIGVQGQSAVSTGVFGTSNTFIGVAGDCSGGVGVSGTSVSRFGSGVSGKSVSGVGVRGESSDGFAGFFIGDTDVFQGTFRVVMGVKSTVVPHPDGSHRQLYCMESPESWFEDFGEGKLIKGKARVRLDSGFASVVKTNIYHVFLTPYSDSNGLFVARRSKEGFEVKEQRNGKSSLSFSYRIVAKRKDVEVKRLAKVKLPEVPKVPEVPKTREVVSSLQQKGMKLQQKVIKLQQKVIKRKLPELAVRKR
jgi:hypothetical protein